MQREKIEIKKGVQGYYPFCVSSLEGIRKAVIPSQPVSLIFCKGRDTTRIPSREGTQRKTKQGMRDTEHSSLKR